jgi:hypothetical protein
MMGAGLIGPSSSPPGPPRLQAAAPGPRTCAGYVDAGQVLRRLRRLDQPMSKRPAGPYASAGAWPAPAWKGRARGPSTTNPPREPAPQVPARRPMRASAACGLGPAAALPDPARPLGAPAGQLSSPARGQEPWACGCAASARCVPSAWRRAPRLRPLPLPPAIRHGELRDPVASLPGPSGSWWYSFEPNAWCYPAHLLRFSAGLRPTDRAVARPRCGRRTPCPSLHALCVAAGWQRVALRRSVPGAHSETRGHRGPLTGRRYRHLLTSAGGGHRPCIRAPTSARSSGTGIARRRRSRPPYEHTGR